MAGGEVVVRGATEGALSRCADLPGALRDVAIASGLYDTVTVVGNTAKVADPLKRFEVCPMTDAASASVLCRRLGREEYFSGLTFPQGSR